MHNVVYIYIHHAEYILTVLDIYIHVHTLMQWTFLETGIKLPIPLLYIYIWDRGFLMKPNKSLTAEKNGIGN